MCIAHARSRSHVLSPHALHSFPLLAVAALMRPGAGHKHQSRCKRAPGLLFPVVVSSVCRHLLVLHFRPGLAVGCLRPVLARAKRYDILLRLAPLSVLPIMPDRPYFIPFPIARIRRKMRPRLHPAQPSDSFWGGLAMANRKIGIS